MNNFSDFDKSFNRTRNFIIGFFVFTAIIMCIIYGTMVYTAVKVVQNPNDTAKELGKLINSFQQGMNDTTNTLKH